MNGPRSMILRAQDAPAPTIVVDGASVGTYADRAACEALVVAARAAAFAEHADIEGLGVKSIVLLPPRDGVVKVEFFQGYAHGDLMPGSQQVCVNSLGCAISAASGWYPGASGTEPVLALMSDQSYVLRRRA